MASAQARLDKAILAHEQAEAEVERLCDILERAADALSKARKTKWAAQRELDEAAKAAKASSSSAPSPRQSIARGRKKQPQAAAAGSPPLPSAGRAAVAARSRYSAARQPSNASNGGGYRRDGPDEAGRYSHDIQSDYSDEVSESEEYISDESEEEGDAEEDSEEEEEDGFDLGNEALEQIRYRLETAKIDPNSPEGSKLLDELLVRLKNSKGAVIDAALVNKLIDELLFESEEPSPPPPQISNGSSHERSGGNVPPSQSPQQHPRIRISRGGKVLGWYQGQLDERGYARQGTGSMYYDAGHECHGTWKDDEMIGRGMYQWSDGHVYDGEWLAGKRHGLGRFIRPDNVILYGRYERGHHKGEGVRWSADRREAQVVVDGVPRKTVSLARAKDIATNLGFDDVLPPV